MSKQLSLSAVISTLAMLAFVLVAGPGRPSLNEKGATAEAGAPLAFEAALPTR